jgi:polar amino acid transport system substrate-binding protein
MVGFEVDLADGLARRLGRKPRFVQNQFEGLIPGLLAGFYDVVINGLEITEDRKSQISFTGPYYATYEQISVRLESPEVSSLKDLRGKVVGTLRASVAERILEGERGVNVRSYDGQINAYEDLANGRLDAVLMDHPIALYYSRPNSKLKFVGEPIGRIDYGIGVRKGDRELLHQLNAALRAMIRSGELRAIYEKWGLWTPLMGDYFADPKPTTSEATEYENYLTDMAAKRSWTERLDQYLRYLPLLGKGALVTLEISLLSMALAVTLGLAVALVRLYAPPPLSLLAVGYIELFRGTPLLVQLFLIFYGLPNVGIRLSPLVAALIGLGLNYGAYEAENYRAGIQAISRGQTEAAFALGMTRLQSLRHVIVPQALRLVIPPITNDFISLFKDSSLVSVITMVELTKVYGQLASTYYDYIGTGILTAAMYLLLGIPFVRLARFLEVRLSTDRAPARR